MCIRSFISAEVFTWAFQLSLCIRSKIKKLKSSFTSSHNETEIRGFPHFPRSRTDRASYLAISSPYYLKSMDRFSTFIRTFRCRFLNTVILKKRGLGWGVFSPRFVYLLFRFWFEYFRIVFTDSKFPPIGAIRVWWLEIRSPVIFISVFDGFPFFWVVFLQFYF